jgi:N-formylglutamate amidohydrolase
MGLLCGSSSGRAVTLSYAMAAAWTPDRQTPPFVRIGPQPAATPLVLAVPHAGTHYPAALLHDAAAPMTIIEALEDRHADLLVGHAVAEGALAIVAQAPRAWIDLNRGEDDLDPALHPHPVAGRLPNARVRSGLGLIPQRIGQRQLWRTTPTVDEVQRRLAAVHVPYHAAVAQALDDAWRRFGFAMLIDCHSMPPLGRSSPARVVIGDRHGRAAIPGLAARLAVVARAEGYPTALNSPYSGAYTLDRHGRPEAGIHAVQLEVDRTLYLRADQREIGPGLQQVRILVANLGREAIATLQPSELRAAE